MRLAGVFFPAFLVAVCARAAAETAVWLRETTESPRTFRVSVALTVTGKLQTAIGGGNAASLNLNVDGRFQYRERLLDGVGSGPEALRSVRQYERAEAEVAVNRQKNVSRLAAGRRRIVAHGRPAGILLYCPDDFLSPDDVMLLQVPADSLVVPALLPERKLPAGATWTPPKWVLPVLTSVEAVKKSHLTCRLTAVTERLATLTFDGKIEGAIYGAMSTITVTGSAQFDLDRRYLRRVQLTQKEKRMIGSVAPGLEVTATMVLERTPASSAPPLD
ncbi:MAG TPA: hypothetical protein EYP14_00055, partial [Planctomycetaceae bacterium]|nr:hypothetical protein [Planctomycetaceae bacterium]